MPQLEPKELYTVAEAFLIDIHNVDGCKSCHEGTKGSITKDNAHAGYITDPSAFDETFCTPCHDDIVRYHESSIHSDLTGYKTLLMQRAGVDKLSKSMDKMLDDRCVECHTTCGQCHISQPDTVGGGLIAGHIFKKTPNQTRNCTACHGSRIGSEFKGENQGFKPSAHYEAGLNCFDCHTGEEIHGPGSAGAIRYDLAVRPECVDCHENPKSYNKQMAQHSDNLACNVCHSQQYKNCYQCHVAKPGSSQPNGIKIPSEMSFKIGRNPLKSAKIPWDYVLLRHVPVAPDTFEEYGIDLGDFASLPTWKYTSPHNIRRSTPQNASCGSCHGHDDLFLTEDYVNERIADEAAFPEELEANEPVIVDGAPD